MNNSMQQPEQLQLFDNYGFWHVPFWQKPWFAVLTALFICAILATLIYLFLRWRRSKKVKLSPAEQALHDLQALKKKGLCSVATSNLFYTRLTGILKNYLSCLFMQDMRSNTDQQMVERIASMPLFDAQKEGLSRIFSAGELIKFARQDALEEQLNRDWQFCVDFVKNATARQDLK